MKEPRKFIITGQGRSGSNLLKFALKGHPEIEVIGEYYNPRVYPQAKELMGNQRAREYYQTAGPKTRAIGFKIFSHHATTSPSKSVWRYLTNKRIYVIHLVRNNSFERLLSLEVANESRAWVASDETDKLHDSIRLDISPTNWLAAIEKDILIEKDLKERFSNNNYIQISYEDLAADPQRVFSEVERFLNVKQMELPISLKKQERLPKHVRCENYDEIVEFFRETKYAWMFEE